MKLYNQSRFEFRLVVSVLSLLVISLAFKNPLQAATKFCSSPIAFFGDDDDEDDEIRFQTVSRLTISFAEEGTQISRFKNSLFSSFSHLMTREELEDQVLEAFQTWAQHSAVNVGLVIEDPEMPEFGIGGMSQGDLRFGDIRVGAVPMAGDVLAVAVPNVDFVSGTWSGDLLFNSNADFVDTDQFFAVALHEAGHVLGLGHTTDPTSVMHPTALNFVLNASDIADLKLLYGERVELDQYDSDDDGNNVDDAVEIKNEDIVEHSDDEIDGRIPLLVFGDIENSSDVDFFVIRPRDFPMLLDPDSEDSEYTGSITFRVISEKVSLLRAVLTILDGNGDEVSAVASMSSQGDICMDIMAADEEEYVIRIESTGDPVYQFGSYALVTTLNENLPQPDFPELIDTAIRKNFGEIDEEDVQQFAWDFANGSMSEIEPDFHTNDTASTATLLVPPLNIALHSAYRDQAVISDSTDIDYYRLTVNDSVMSVRVNALDVNPQSDFGLISNISVFDSAVQPLAGETKVNGNGELLIEYEGMVIGDDYFIAVNADQPNGPFGTGNYDLNVAFSDQPRLLDVLGTGAVTNQNRVSLHTLYVARSQLFHFAAEAFDQFDTPDVTIWMSIYDETGELKYRVSTRPDEFRSSKSVILGPGSYSVRVVRTSTSTMPSVPTFGPATIDNQDTPLVARGGRRSTSLVRYRIDGIGISEPTGPEVIDPSDDPFSPCDKSGSDFCYPNDRISPDPFIIVTGGEFDPGPVNDPDHTDANTWYWQLDWLG